MQIGCAEFRIDLAIRDPEKAGRYILGIECDGATYHSARSARDRDKLRQRVLQDRGWNLHRIWSHDWWQDREGEIARLVLSIEQARQSTPLSPSCYQPLRGNESFVQVDQPKSPTKLNPYVAAPLSGPLVTEQQLRAYMISVVQHEGPIKKDLLVSRLRVAAGYGRVGNRLRFWLEDLINQAIDSGHIHEMVDAYYTSNKQLTSARDWSNRPAEEKQSLFVTEVELAVALQHLVRRAFGVKRTDAVRETYKLMGFRRVTSEAISRGSRVVDRMLKSGGLREKDSLLFSNQSTQQ